MPIYAHCTCSQEVASSIPRWPSAIAQPLVSTVNDIPKLWYMTSIGIQGRFESGTVLVMSVMARNVTKIM